MYTARMQLYPVFLSLKSCKVLVVGAGAVGKRKITSLCAAEAGNILVLDPVLSSESLVALNAMPNVVAIARRAVKTDIVGRQLVFAATGDGEENARLAALCLLCNVFCNVADDPDAGSFHVPAMASVNGLTLAVSTGGMSPALAKRVRMEASAWMETTYGPLAMLLGKLRPLVLAQGGETEAHSRVFRAVAYSQLGVLLQNGRIDAARGLLHTLLPETLHEHIEELLNGLF